VPAHSLALAARRGNRLRRIRKIIEKRRLLNPTLIKKQRPRQDPGPAVSWQSAFSAGRPSAPPGRKITSYSKLCFARHGIASTSPSWLAKSGPSSTSALPPPVIVPRSLPSPQGPGRLCDRHLLAPAAIYVCLTIYKPLPQPTNEASSRRRATNLPPPPRPAPQLHSAEPRGRSSSPAFSNVAPNPASGRAARKKRRELTFNLKEPLDHENAPERQRLERAANHPRCEDSALIPRPNSFAKKRGRRGAPAIIVSIADSETTS